MSNKDVKFSFSINDNNFSSKIQGMNKEMKVLGEQVKQASNEVIASGNSLDALGKKYDTLNKSLEQAKTKVLEYEKQIEKQNESIEKSKIKLTELANKKADVNKKYSESIEATGKESEASQKLKEELDKLDKQYKNTEKSITSKEKTLQNYGVAMAQAETAVSNLEGELKNCAKEIENQGNQFANASVKLQENAEKFKAVGGKIDEVSSKVLAMSTAVLAGGVSIGKMNMDFEAGIANINTLLDDTGNLDGYKNKIIELSNDTGISLKTMSDGMYQAISALGDGGAETEKIFETMSKSAKAGGAEVSDSVSLISAGMKAYGSVNDETAKKISDLAFQTAKLGVTTFPEMASSMQQLFPLASSLNLSLEDLFGSMATLTGVTGNTSEVSTQLKAVFSNLIKPTKEMAGLMEQYGYANGQAMLEAEGLQGVLKILQSETGGQADKMGVLFSSTEALTAITALCGANFEDFVNKSDSMNNSMGATNTALEKVSATAKDKLDVAVNKLKNSFVQLGEGSTPLIEGVTKAIETLATTLGDMDAETVTNITNMALWGAGLGVAGKAVGGVVSGVGSLTSGLSTVSSLLSTTSIASVGLGTALGSVSGVVGALAVGFYAAHEANDVMNSSVVKAKDEFSLMERGMASLMGVQLASREELEAQGLIYKQFSENTSQEFILAVEGMRTDVAEFGIALNEINLDEVLTEEELTNLNTRVQVAVDGAVGAINEKSAEMNSAMSNLFAVDGVLSEKETEIITWWNSRGDKEIEEAKNLQLEITEIEKLAFAEGRALTEEEVEAIQSRYERIKQIELMCKAKNNEELLFAQKEFETQVATMDVENAAKLLQSKRQQADDLLAQKKVEIEVLKTQAMQGYEDLNEEDKKYVDDTIKMYDDTYADLEEENRQFYKDSLTYLEEHNTEAYNKIDIYSGKVLTKADERCRGVLEKEKAKYTELDKVTETGMYSMYNSISGSYDDIFVKVDEVTGNVVGIGKTFISENGIMSTSVCGANKEIVESMKDTELSYTNAFNKISTGTVDETGKVVDSNGKVVTSLKNVKENADGTKEAVVELNGKHVKVTVNKDGTIKDLQQITNTINAIPTEKTVTIRVQKVGDSEAYAVGTPSTSKSGIANVNENGWELIDNTRETPTLLGNALKGEMAYLPEGTRVQTHLSSVQQMKAEISKEVDKKINSKATRDIEKYLVDIIKQLKSENKSNNATYNVNADFPNANSAYEIERALINIDTIARQKSRR